MLAIAIFLLLGTFDEEKNTRLNISDYMKFDIFYLISVFPPDMSALSHQKRTSWHYFFIIFLQVKVLYVRNLQLATTEDTIENLFKQFAEVERVKKIKDYCFVHFSTKEGARHALDSMQGMIIPLYIFSL